jgi:hypothetical protein
VAPKTGGDVIVILAVDVQVFVSEAVTVYTPAGSASAVVADVSPVVHTKAKTPVPPVATAAA